VEPFGAISAGQIRICGPLTRMKLTPKKKVGRTSYPDFTPVRVMASTSYTFNCTIDLDNHTTSDFGQTIEVHALTICRNKGFQSLRGLLLQPATGHLRGTFSRIGTFTVEEKTASRFLEVGTQYKDPALVYEEENGTGYYTVNII
jgi:hypothetical protein